MKYFLNTLKQTGSCSVLKMWNLPLSLHNIKILHIGSTHQQWKNDVQKNFKAYVLNKT